MSVFVRMIAGFALCALAQNATAATGTVTPGTKYQTIQGFGGGSVYYNSWLPQHPNKQMIYDTIFNGLGLSYLRIGNWNQDSTATLTDDSTIIAEAKKRLGSHLRIIMSSWSAPGYLKASGQVNGSTNNTNLGARQNTLLKKNSAYVYADFASWWLRSLQKYATKNIIPDDISIQNEPDMNADYAETLFGATETDSIAGYPQALKAVTDSLKKLTTIPRVLGPEVLGIGYGNFQKYAKAMDQSLVGAYNFHLYHGGSYTKPDDYNTIFATLATTYGTKPLIMSEFCNMNTHTAANMLSGAQIMINALTKANVTGYINWDLLWGDSTSQMIFVENPWKQTPWTTTNGYVVEPEYHTIRHFSKFINPGWSRIDMTSDDANIRVAAFTSVNQDSLTVVAVNVGSAANTLTLAPTGYGVPKDFWQSQVGGALSKQKTITASQTSFALPDSSISTFVFVKASAASILKGPQQLTQQADHFDFYDLSGHFLGTSTTIPINKSSRIVVARDKTGMSLGSWMIHE